MSDSLDAPDKPGWWAFEGAYNTHPNSGTFRDIVEVVEKDGKLIFGSALDWIDIGEVTGKWTFLQLPWENGT